MEKSSLKVFMTTKIVVCSLSQLISDRRKGGGQAQSEKHIIQRDIEENESVKCQTTLPLRWLD